ncbi:hypothetical protein TNCV_3426871 [Trichonephila clavipes]|nr:hypothetical protein TNCV_3426871 [Trichonephila clavipes]
MHAVIQYLDPWASPGFHPLQISTLCSRLEHQKIGLSRRENNTVPMQTCTPKYCGVLSSDITPTIYVREKTKRLDTCEPETPSVMRGARNKHSPSQDRGVEKGFR